MKYCDQQYKVREQVLFQSLESSHSGIIGQISSPSSLQKKSGGIRAKDDEIAPKLLMRMYILTPANINVLPKTFSEQNGLLKKFSDSGFSGDFKFMEKDIKSLANIHKWDYWFSRVRNTHRGKNTSLKSQYVFKQGQDESWEVGMMLSNTHNNTKIYHHLFADLRNFIHRQRLPNFHLNTETNLLVKPVTDDAEVCITLSHTWAQAHAVAISKEEEGEQLVLLLGQTSFPHIGNPGHKAAEVTALNKGHV